MRTGRGAKVVRALRRRAAGAILPPVEARLRRVVAEEVDRVVAEEVDRVIEALAEVDFRARRDLLAAGERDAALSSAKFVERAMPTARSFTDPESTLRYALEIAPHGGMALEFGVFAGRPCG